MSQGKQEAVTKKSRIPQFKSYAEEAEFWDTHDITEFEDETHPVKVYFVKPNAKSVFVHFDPDANSKHEPL